MTADFEKKIDEAYLNADKRHWLDDYQAFASGYIAGAKENQSQAQWHYPSKGKLPEKEKKVYAIIRRGLRVSDEFAFYQIETDSVCDMSVWVDSFGNRIDVEYWQYLPEPPKEGVC